MLSHSLILVITTTQFIKSPFFLLVFHWRWLHFFFRVIILTIEPSLKFTTCLHYFLSLSCCRWHLFTIVIFIWRRHVDIIILLYILLNWLVATATLRIWRLLLLHFKKIWVPFYFADVNLFRRRHCIYIWLVKDTVMHILYAYFIF